MEVLTLPIRKTSPETATSALRLRPCRVEGTSGYGRRRCPPRTRTNRSPRKQGTTDRPPREARQPPTLRCQHPDPEVTATAALPDKSGAPTRRPTPALAPRNRVQAARQGPCHSSPVRRHNGPVANGGTTGSDRTFDVVASLVIGLLLMGSVASNAARHRQGASGRGH